MTDFMVQAVRSQEGPLRAGDSLRGCDGSHWKVVPLSQAGGSYVLQEVDDGRPGRYRDPADFADLTLTSITGRVYAPGQLPQAV